MRGNFIQIIVFLIGVLLLISLSKSIYNLWHKGDFLEEEEKHFAKARLENEELNREYEKLKSPEYIEREAREKLGLGKEGEVVVILPPQSSRSSEEEKKTETEKEVPVWKQWVEFLLK